MPQFLSIILIIGVMLAILDPQIISKLIGQQSGYIGMIIAAIIGSVTLIHGFVTFPLAVIPLLLFEVSAMGWRFMVIKFIIDANNSAYCLYC